MAESAQQPTRVQITVGPHSFVARLEWAAAPRTCAAFLALLPWEKTVVQARWSGNAVFVPLRDFRLGVGFENATSHPAPGELLFFDDPWGTGTEVLFPYGGTCFASPRGQQAANHFLTVIEGNDQLKTMGELVWRGGAQTIRFARSS